jgi:hypothetical protein
MVPASGPRLKNRVDPFGAFHATVARGSLMGNQGGRLHRDDRTLGRRRWTSKRRVPCRCKFKSRRREVWSGGYTELFFLDEPMALAAGPAVFRMPARAAKGVPRCVSGAPRNADAMDEVLHAERLIGCGKTPLAVAARRSAGRGNDCYRGGRGHALRDGNLLPWSFAGYEGSVSGDASLEVAVLPLPSMVAVIIAGYRPLWTNESEPSA